MGRRCLSPNIFAQNVVHQLCYIPAASLMHLFPKPIEDFIITVKANQRRAWSRRHDWAAFSVGETVFRFHVFLSSRELKFRHRNNTMRLPLFPNRALQAFHGLRCEEPFIGFHADSHRDIFNDKNFSIFLEHVSNFCSTKASCHCAIIGNREPYRLNHETIAD